MKKPIRRGCVYIRNLDLDLRDAWKKKCVRLDVSMRKRLEQLMELDSQDLINDSKPLPKIPVKEEP